MKFDRILFVRRSGGMADAQDSGACSRKAVWVQVPSSAAEDAVTTDYPVGHSVFWLLKDFPSSLAKERYAQYNEKQKRSAADGAGEGIDKEESKWNSF